MNKERRKEISKIADEIRTLQEQLSAALADFGGKFEDLREAIERVKDDEQEYYDNMPESFQYGEKGEQASEAIDNLDNAIQEFATLAEELETLSDDGKWSEVLDYLESAGG